MVLSRRLGLLRDSLFQRVQTVNGEESVPAVLGFLIKSKITMGCCLKEKGADK